MSRFMRGYKFVLKGGKPVPEPDVLKWGRWMESADRRVKVTAIDDVRISTVFLGIDMSLGLGKRPTLYETMIFGGKHDGEMWRCATKEVALKYHKVAEVVVKHSLPGSRVLIS